MAIMMPSVLPKKATSGERLLYEVCKKYFPEDWVVYYEPYIEGSRPDLVIIIPTTGILTLEIKDYKKSSLVKLGTTSWEVLFNGKKDSVDNPIEQARRGMFSIVNKLTTDDELLVDSSAGRKLKFGYSCGVVFTNLTRYDVLSSGMDQIIPDNLILTGDEIKDNSEEFDATLLVEQVLAMFPFKPSWARGMEPSDMLRIRWNLFPEIRMSDPVQVDENKIKKLRTLKAMTLYQEDTARQIGSGHRLIRGVAGSGKTKILVARAKLLSRDYPKSKIVICCFSVILSRDIKSSLEEEFSNIEVYTYHEFLFKYFKVWDDSLSEALIDGIGLGIEKSPGINSLLIDEAQDLDISWVKLLVNCVKEDGTILLAEDRAQNIFRRKNSMSKDLGLDFRGRSKILKVNFRNTKQVVELSWKFLKDNYNGEYEEIIDPEATNRQGPEPHIRLYENLSAECSNITTIINYYQSKGISLEEIAILYRVQKDRSANYVDTLLEFLNKEKIEHSWVSKNRNSKSKYDSKSGGVKVLTLDSSKGLDFRVVIIMNCDILPLSYEEDKDREAFLMYIGMTRSTEHLVLTGSRNEGYLKYFLDNLKEV